MSTSRIFKCTVLPIGWSVIPVKMEIYIKGLASGWIPTSLGMTQTRKSGMRPLCISPRVSPYRTVSNYV